METDIEPFLPIIDECQITEKAMLKFYEGTINGVEVVTFISIRSVTDTETHSDLDHFEENCEKASIIAKDITVALLAEIN